MPKNFVANYKQLLKNIPFVLAAIKPNGALLFENSQFSSIDEGNYFLHFKNQPTLHATKETLLRECKKAIVNDEPASFELHNKLTKNWQRCHLNLVKDANHKIIFALLSAFDITERKRVEELLRRSQEMLVDAQDIAHLGTWEWDLSKNQLTWSDELYRIYDVTPKNYMASYENYLKKIIPEDREKVILAMTRAFENNECFSHDERIFRPDGSIRYLHTWGQPVTDESGEIIRMMGVCQDVTDQKLAQTNLEEALSLLRATIESTADGILVVDMSGRIVTYNQKFTELWNLPENILHSRDDSQALDFVLSQLKHPNQFITKVQELYSHPTSESFDVLEFKDERVFERYSKPQKIDNQPIGRVWSFRDITARVHAEKEALAASIAKTQFLANMSHEIRTPLTAVLGFSDLLASFSMNPSERVDLAAKVKSQGDHLLRIVNDILDLSKIEFGHFYVKESPVNILELIQELTEVFSFQIKDKKIRLLFSVVGNIPSQIQSDPVRLKQILINLIGNAIKFTWSGLVEVTLSLVHSPENLSQLSFRVRDTGIGIEETQMKKLFEPFTQVDSSLTRKYGGTGLGLALSKNLASALGGTVRLLESHPGIGSTFEAVVNTGPIDPATLMTDLKAKLALDIETENRKSPFDLSGIKILLVEDSADNQFLVTQFLKKAGASIVDVASNGKEGVKMSLAGSYDIVFMDLQMPLMNGYEATRELRKKGFAKPIVALTAHAIPEEIQRCLDAGCDFHISKPIDHAQLIATAYRLTRTTTTELEKSLAV